MRETVGRKAETEEETTVTERAARAGKEMDMGRRGRGVEVAAEKGTGTGRRKEREEGTETVTMITKEAGAMAEIVIASEIGSLNSTLFQVSPCSATFGSSTRLIMVCET